MTSRLHRVTALDRVELMVAQGEVHGLLGANGAGKTTLLKILVGLMRPSSGSVALFGKEHSRFGPTTLDGIGAVIDHPRFVPSFSGRQNLELLAVAMNSAPGAVDSSLNRVGLAAAKERRFSSYSLGMRQKLSLAAAFMRQARLLILDEPTNGLDPESVVQIRDHIRAFAKSGGTVLMSSHNLTEVEAVADSISVLREGKMVAAGTLSEIFGELDPPSLVLSSNNAVQLKEILLNCLPEVCILEDSPESLEVQELSVDQIAVLNQECVQRGVVVSEMVRSKRNLEDAFLRITSDDKRQ